jgi:hypothetical protein
MTPIAQFESVWGRCAVLSGLYTYLERNVAGVLQPEELLRAEWVSRVSALDLYVHEVIAQSMVAIFEGRRPITPAYSRFQISNEALDRIRAASTRTEASAAFDLYVRTQLSRVTYQFPDDIADGIRLCSEAELWNEIALALGATPSTKNDLAKNHKRQLSLIVRRRNAIAHEGDLQQTALRDPWPIKQADLTEVSKFIEGVVRAIDTII